MGLLCKLLGHDWKLHGGLARNASPSHDHPPQAQYGCRRCGKRRHINGATVQFAMQFRRNPDKLEEVINNE